MVSCPRPTENEARQLLIRAKGGAYVIPPLPKKLLSVNDCFLMLLLRIAPANILPRKLKEASPIKSGGHMHSRKIWQ